MKRKTRRNDRPEVRSKPKLTGVQKLILAGTATASLAIGGAIAYRSFSEPNKPPRVEQRAKISFQEAQRDETLRQRYIDQKAYPLSKEFDRSFKSRITEAIVYDHDFGQLDEACRLGLEKYGADSPQSTYFRNIIKQNQENRERENQKILGMTILPTVNFAEGGASEIYFSKDCFNPELVASEDEFLSLLDHEMFHAACNNKGMPIKHEVGAKYGLDSISAVEFLNPDLVSASFEVVAFNFQLKEIDEGRRKVGPAFRQRTITSYNNYYQTIKSFADRNDGSLDSRFSSALIEYLTYHPRLRKY